MATYETVTLTVRDLIEKFKAGEFNSPETSIQIDAGWFDWFCKESSLRAKTYKLYPKVIKFCEVMNIDLDKNYVFFKNNCPMNGSLYDSFSICDVQTGDVQYWVCPRSGHRSDNGQGYIVSREFGFGNENAIARGSWSAMMKQLKEKQYEKR